ncbi:MAG TPA: hypothetical protein PKW87_07100 [Bacillota bacterium]|jgi:hypothetical protein|nr:hypothetical protein [Bacillota bacterium]
MILSPTQLEKLRYSCQGWVAVFNENMERLNDTLLKVASLTDVQLSGLADGDVLRYNSGTKKWVNVKSGFLTTTTT